MMSDFPGPGQCLGLSESEITPVTGFTVIIGFAVKEMLMYLVLVLVGPQLTIRLSGIDTLGQPCTRQMPSPLLQSLKKMLL